MEKYAIPSVSHACGIFRVLAGASAGMTMGELEAALGLPRTTLFRLLRTLCDEQMLEKKGKRYHCGTELTRLGLHMLNSEHLHQMAIPHIQRLAIETGYTAHLAVPSHNKVLIVEVVDSPNSLMVSKRPGTLTDMYCSSTGKIFLALLYYDNLEILVREQPLSKRTSNTITSMDNLKEELKRVIALGYAVDDREYNEDVRCLAVAVRDNRGVVVASLGVTAPAVSFPKSRIPQVANLAKEASRRIYTDTYQLKGLSRE